MSGQFNNVSGYGGSIAWRSPVQTAADLPPDGNLPGDAISAQDTGVIYVWNGVTWIAQSGGPTPVTGVTATYPVISSGGSAPVISLGGLGTSPGTLFYVDGTSGDDSTGTGSSIAPFKTLTQAFLSAVDGDAILISGTCSEPNGPLVLKPGVNLASATHAFVGTGDDSGITLDYDGTAGFGAFFTGITFLDSDLVITRIAGTNTPDIFSGIFFNSCEVNNLTMTGSGDTANGVFDQLDMNNSHFASVDIHAVTANVRSTQCAGIYSADSTGVDTQSTDGLNSNLFYSRVQRYILSEYVGVNAKNTSTNRVALNDVNAFFSGDAASFPSNFGNGIQLNSGATMDQLFRFSRTNNLQNRVREITDDGDELSVTDDFIASVNFSAPGTLNLPEMSGSTYAEGVRFIIHDSAGNASTNTITLASQGSDLFENGTSSLVINANYGSVSLYYDAPIWRMISSNGNLYGDVIAGDIELLNSFTSNFWGPGMLGVVSNSLLFNQTDAANKAIIFASTDLSSNEAFIPVDVAMQSGSNLGNNLSLPGTHATGNVWINTGDIPNDLSGNGYKPGTIHIQAGANIQESIAGGVEISTVTSLFGGATPSNGEIKLRGQIVTVVDATNGTTVIAEFDGSAHTLSMHSNKIVSLQDPTSAQDAATKAYVDAQAGSTVSTINTGTTGVLGTTYFVDTSGGAFNFTLPAPVAGKRIWIKDSKGTFGSNNLTLVRHASEKIEGVAASKVLSSSWGAYEIVSDGTDWFML